MAPYFSRIWINLSALDACDLILFLLSLSPFFLGAVGGPEIPPDGWFAVRESFSVAAVASAFKLI